MALLKYIPERDFNGVDTVQFSFGASSLSAPSKGLECEVRVLPVNDAPVISAPMQLVVDEDEPVELRGIFVTDVDVLEAEGSLLLFRASTETGVLKFAHGSMSDRNKCEMGSEISGRNRRE